MSVKIATTPCLKDSFQRSGVYPRKEINTIAKMLNNIRGKDGITVVSNPYGIEISGNTIQNEAENNHFHCSLATNATGVKNTIEVHAGLYDFIVGNTVTCLPMEIDGGGSSYLYSNVYSLTIASNTASTQYVTLLVDDVRNPTIVTPQLREDLTECETFPRAEIPIAQLRVNTESLTYNSIEQFKEYDINDSHIVTDTNTDLTPSPKCSSVEFDPTNYDLQLRGFRAESFNGAGVWIENNAEADTRTILYCATTGAGGDCNGGAGTGGDVSTYGLSAANHTHRVNECDHAATADYADECLHAEWADHANATSISHNQLNTDYYEDRRLDYEDLSDQDFRHFVQGFDYTYNSCQSIGYNNGTYSSTMQSMRIDLYNKRLHVGATDWSLDWNDCILQDLGSQKETANWSDCTLTDKTTQHTSVNWACTTFYNLTTEVGTGNWNDCELYESVAGKLTLAWGAYTLHDGDETEVCNWNEVTLKTHWYANNNFSVTNTCEAEKFYIDGTNYWSTSSFTVDVDNAEIYGGGSNITMGSNNLVVEAGDDLYLTYGGDLIINSETYVPTQITANVGGTTKTITVLAYE